MSIEKNPGHRTCLKDGEATTACAAEAKILTCRNWVPLVRIAIKNLWKMANLQMTGIKDKVFPWLC